MVRQGPRAVGRTGLAPELLALPSLVVVVEPRPGGLPSPRQSLLSPKVPTAPSALSEPESPSCPLSISENWALKNREGTVGVGGEGHSWRLLPTLLHPPDPVEPGSCEAAGPRMAAPLTQLLGECPGADHAAGYPASPLGFRPSRRLTTHGRLTKTGCVGSSSAL